MHLVYLLKESFALYPPCLAHAHMMLESGVKVSVVAGACPPATKAGLESAGAQVILVGDERRFGGLLRKADSYARFRSLALKAIKELPSPPDAVWFGTADTAIALIGALREMRFGVSVLELYDRNPLYRTALAKILPLAAAVLACEPTRAEIMQSWFGLRDTPLVVPNKGHEHPRLRGLPAETPELAAAIQEIKSQRRILLYQGLITADRALTPLASGLARAGLNDWTLCLMGPVRGDSLSRVQSRWSNTMYLGTFEAPSHLAVTSHAHVGVAYYDRSSINNILCAPNKVYEYAGFGLPILANDVAGLRNTVGQARAGLCVDFSSPGAVADALCALDAEYDGFSERASALFESTDSRATITTLLDRLCGA